MALRTYRLFRFLLMPLWLLAGLHCKDRGVEPAPERVTLTLIDVAVTEAYLHIAVTNPASNETLALERDGRTVMTFPAVADTHIADTALTQTTAYQYTARLVANNEATGTSNTISAQTLTPTSHSFSWQTFLLGDGNGSALYDVVLINDTLAYAVGEIYLSGDPLPYNLAQWNGETWNIQKVPYYFQGQPFYSPIRAVFAFTPDNIWFGIGNMIHWDGQTFTSVPLPSNVWGPYLINRIWGHAGEIWIVGNEGSIAYRSVSGTWQRLESGTTTRIIDIWGVVSSVTHTAEAFCSVSSFFTPGDRRILRISNQTRVDSIRWDTGTVVYSVWTSRGFPLFTAGQQVYVNQMGQWRSINTGMQVSTNSIRGLGLNDIVVAGDLGYLSHYNGEHWEVIGTDATAGYSTVRMLGNTLIAVGNKNGRGFINIGRRQGLQ